MAFIKKEAGSAPVLLVSGFAEGADFQSVSDPKLRDILFAPEEYYGAPEGAIRVPHQFPVRDTASLEMLARRLALEHRFYIVNNKPDSSYELWFLGRFGTRCTSEAMGQRFGLVWISRFACK